jgi:hypothetical protein
MSRFARVGSIEMLKELRGSLCIFAELASNVLDEADAEIQRTVLWLKLEQHTYWKTQVRLRSEQLVQAKQALERKKHLDKSPLGGTYSYIDEKKAFTAAQRKFQEAEQKLANVKKWILQLEHEVFNYKGAVQGLASAVSLEIPNANTQIDRMVDALESYTALAPPAEAPPTPVILSSEGFTQAESTAPMTREAKPPDPRPDKQQEDETPSQTNNDSGKTDDSETKENHEPKS